jgi:YHS domain-containing protein
VEKEIRKEEKHMVRDPVCGMEIDEKKAAEKVHYQGRTFYFCSPGCRAAFERDPEKYVRTQEGGGHH